MGIGLSEALLRSGADVVIDDMALESPKEPWVRSATSKPWRKHLISQASQGVCWKCLLHLVDVCITSNAT